MHAKKKAHFDKPVAILCALKAIIRAMRLMMYDLFDLRRENMTEFVFTQYPHRWQCC